MEILSLYDILVGCFPSEWPNPLGQPDVSLESIDALSEDQKLRMSITESIKMILQTRRGSVLHLPDFGIPNVLQLFFDSGGSLDPFREEIRETLLRYEPRLSDVQVEKEFFDQNNMRISLRIVARIRGLDQEEVFLTEFSTTGWTKVIPDQKSS
jgi:type VI secretion system lysozyme-like protein